MLDPEQKLRLQTLMQGLDSLASETDQEGAAEILELIYESVTQIYDRFPTLDADEEE